LRDKEKIISGLAAPARYLGLEANQVIKDPCKAELNFALVFPEIYEIGMSHQGLKILYDALATRKDVNAERVFMPWNDLIERLEAEGVSPWSQENRLGLDEFDALGFSLAYELTYTNMLHMLRLSNIPLRHEDRGPEHPVVIAGGTAMVNPEPMADFVDFAIVGEADQLIHQIADILIQNKKQAWDRQTLYEKASEIDGIYCPSLFEPVYVDGKLSEIKALKPGYSKVKRALVPDLEAQPLPKHWVMPALKPVHDRLGLEAARGCTRGCRFCQAGYMYRPVRERSAQSLYEGALEGIACTGFEEMALLSLSTGDYTCIEELACGLMDALEQEKVGLSLPSLRMDSLSDELVKQVKRVRKTGFTLAPEAGSQRLRDVINKCLDEDQILNTVKTVFDLGWRLVKLYFMMGLPTETDRDMEDLARLSSLVAKASGKMTRKPVVHASVGVFVPKPHTPFQWEAQISQEEAWRRLDLIKASLRDKRVKLKWNAPAASLLEGVLSRGDRRLGKALEYAVEAGCRFDGWGEQLDLAAWLGALQKADLNLDEYLGPRGLDDPLPWDHIDLGLGKDFLKGERNRAFEERATGDCRNGACQGCGVCDLKTIMPRTAQNGKLKPLKRPDHSLNEPTTYRFRLSKTGPARHWGHLEMISQLVRAFKRAGVGLAYSQGFHPQPKVKLTSALPLGVESLAEELEVSITGGESAATVCDMVNPVLPPGLGIGDGRLRRPGEKLSEPDEVSYIITTPAPLDPEDLLAFEQSEELEYLRTTPKGTRRVDIKANIRQISLESDGLHLTVGRMGARPKPEEVLTAVFNQSPEDAARAKALKVGLLRYPRKK
jgi:radical SAM family uncharacterized protein/radical SAM-linked protein